jgi:hypothetical protein
MLLVVAVCSAGIGRRVAHDTSDNENTLSLIADVGLTILSNDLA